MARALVTALLSMSVLACGSVDHTIDVVHDPCEPVVLVVGPGAAPAERASVVEAAQIWNELPWMDVSVADEATPSAVPVHFRDAPALFLGVYEDESGLLLVNRRLDDARARSITIAHELGHAMGLVHVDGAERASVMNPANVETLPTGEDEHALLDLWGDCSARRAR